MLPKGNGVRKFKVFCENLNFPGLEYTGLIQSGASSWELRVLWLQVSSSRATAAGRPSLQAEPAMLGLESGPIPLPGHPGA